MGVKLEDLQRDSRTITFPVRVGEDENGADLTEDVTLIYQPSQYTGQMERTLNEDAKGEWKSAVGIHFITLLVIEWDVMKDEATPLALDEDDLALLPSATIGEVITAIAADMGKAQAT